MEDSTLTENSNVPDHFGFFLAKLVVTTLLFLGVFLLWRASEIFLIVFAGILLAIFLQTFSTWISKKARIPYPLALVSLVVFLVVFFISIFRLFAPTLATQAAILAEEIPRAFNFLQVLIDRYIPFSKETVQTVFANFNLLQQVTTIFSTTMGAITSLILFLFVGIYLAFDYRIYVAGFLRLFPLDKRVTAERILAACGETLRLWLVGQILAMIVLGIATVIGLYLLEIPLAFILGLLAGLLTFLPTLGPILSAIPAVLVALIQGPLQVTYVILLYIALQILESYFITPLIQKQTTALPPALVVVIQILMGVLAGILGLALAAPITAVSIVLVDQIYVKEILEKKRGH
ncbi:MAG: AI-2E family transporter [Parachlamydiaceae bacterium]